EAVAVLGCPSGIALAGGNDGCSEVVREGGGSTAIGADAAPCRRRMASGRRGGVVQRGEARRAVQRIPIRGTVELNGLVHQPITWRGRRIDEEVRVGDR